MKAESLKSKAAGLIRLLTSAATILSAEGAHVKFVHESSDTSVQASRHLILYTLAAPYTNGAGSIVTRDWLSRTLDTNGQVTISNLYSGPYMEVVQGTTRSTTNFYVFPDTNGLIMAADWVTNSGVAVTFGSAYSQAQADARFYPLLTNPSNYVQSVNGSVPEARLRYPFLVVHADGTVVGPNGVISTAGTTTCGIKEAWDTINTGADLLHPAGGKIYLADSAPYYITGGLLFSNYYCGDVELFGPGLMAGGIVRVDRGPVIKITSFRTPPSVAQPVCPMALHIHDLFIASLTNTPGTNLIEIDDFGRGEIDHNWIGYYSAMTNNNQSSGSTNLVGFSTCTFGFGVSNTALIGISVRGVSDLMEIHGNSFLGLAASGYIGSDHVRVWNNFDSYVGISNACPNTSPFSLGAAWVIQPDLSHNDLYIDGNFHYNCQAGYFLFSTNLAGSYNYNSVVGRNDTYEATSTNVLITANLRMKQYDPAFLRASANNNAIVSTYPSFAVQNGRIESDRVVIINSRTNRFNLAGEDLILGNGRAGILNTAATGTNSFYAYSCGISAANGLYTDPVTGPDGPGSDEIVFTNHGSGYYFMIDPQQGLMQGNGLGAIFNTSGVQEYAFSPSIDDPMVWQAQPLDALNHGTAPIGQIQAVLSGISTVFTGDGSGLNNLTAQAGGVTWATNSTAPVNTTTIRAWLTVTNDSGKVGKVPVYY